MFWLDNLPHYLLFNMFNALLRIITEQQLLYCWFISCYSVTAVAKSKNTSCSHWIATFLFLHFSVFSLSRILWICWQERCLSCSMFFDFSACCSAIVLKWTHICDCVWKWKKSKDDIFRNSVTGLQVRQRHTAGPRGHNGSTNWWSDSQVHPTGDIYTKKGLWDKWVARPGTCWHGEKCPKQTIKTKTTWVSHRNVRAFECTLSLQDKANIVSKGSTM